MCLRFVILLVFLLAEQVLASVSTTASSAPAVAETTVFEGVSENEKGIVSRPTPFDEGSWYIDATNGDDNLGDGSREKPFKSIRKILSINKLSTNYLRSGDTLYLAEGNYNEDSISIDIPELSIVGTLNKYGRPVSVLGEVRITASEVTLMNCKFFNTSLTLQNVEDVAICNNIFYGETKTSLSLLGASGNLISRNEFRSSTENAVSIDRDLVSGKSSSDNLFLKNYFTHNPDKKTERIILVHWDSDNNTSMSVRNRFIACAFEELIQGQLTHVIDDENPPNMVVDHGYSVQFEDCYFKRAERAAPFNQFTLLKKDSESSWSWSWSWDELINDNWVASNHQSAITGDHKKQYLPRIQFIDGNNNGATLETSFNSGLLLLEDDLSVSKTIPAEETVHDESDLSVPFGDVIRNRSDWYVDSVKGDNEKGNGSESSPFKSIETVLKLNESYPSYVGSGDIVYLASGQYGLNPIEINIPDLSIKGTLDKYGEPVSKLSDVKITASGVTLMNCEFPDVGLILQNVERVHVSNNVFSGATEICLSLLGASNNTISHNEFRSAMYDCVYIYWNPSSQKVSSDNIFLRNYFTHRPDGETNRVVRVNWSPGNNDSISARNRFVRCAFKETTRGQLKRIVDDDSTWWMVVKNEYSIRFEDCYFKRADRMNPFREFVILKGHPDFEWRWDELVNDTWVTTNTQFCLTGDYNNWNHKPRLQFIDGNRNSLVFEMAYSAGLLPSGNPTDVIEK